MTLLRKKTLNCWEALDCGREPGGAHSAEYGVCPAATADVHDGTNHGNRGGRYCWRIAGTLCSGEVQGSFAQKVSDCGQCAFFLSVLRQEGAHFKT